MDNLIPKNIGGMDSGHFVLFAVGTQILKINIQALYLLYCMFNFD